MQHQHTLLGWREWPSGDWAIWKCFERLPPMGLSTLTISHNEDDSIPSDPLPVQRGASGSRGLTRLGALRVRSGAAILERNYRRDCLTFWTGTLPFPDGERLALAAGDAGEALRRFAQGVARALRKAGLPAHIVWVAELQARGALHWHAVWVGRHAGKHWAIDLDRIDELWRRAWAHFDWSGGFSWQSACNVQRVKKSITGYLSKYISKGRNLELPEGVAHPRQWWGMSDSIRDLIEAGMKNGSVEVYTDGFSWFDTLDKFLRLAGQIFASVHITATGLITCIYGRMTAQARASPLDVIDFLT